MKKTSLFLFLLGACALAIACKSSKKSSAPDNFMLVIERTACYGQCPSYSVEVKSDRSVKYHGRNFVDMKGLYAKTLDKKTFASLVEKANSANFAQYDDKYDNPGISDLPSLIITYRSGDVKKEIVARYEYPKELDAIANELEQLIGKEGYEKMEE